MESQEIEHELDLVAAEAKEIFGSEKEDVMIMQRIRRWMEKRISSAFGDQVIVGQIEYRPAREEISVYIHDYLNQRLYVLRF